MDSSDSEPEACKDLVSSYYFEDDTPEWVSFSVLPIQWHDDVKMDGSEKQLVLRGTTDEGLQRMYQSVVAWKFDLSGEEPCVSVVGRDNKWLKLDKPRKNYGDIVRSTLITLRCLHILKKNPDVAEKSLWDQLSKAFGWYDIRPNLNDLIDHWIFIEEAVKRDTSLGNSKFLMALLKEKPEKNLIDEDALKSGSFIVDDVDNDGSQTRSEEEDEQGFAVCEICDNGGDVLTCEGSCLRSFHPTPGDEDAEDSCCTTLGLSQREVEETPTFLCQNCKYMQHQCFSCGRLGCSDVNAGAEVFLCINATCGRFYHPKCVAKLLHRGDDAAAAELESKIATGEKFACPVHKCNVCGKGEDVEDHDLQFALCRRCPTSYHRKCLSREIIFYKGEDEAGVIARAWDDLLPDHRILLYCLKHEIVAEYGTPDRNHIKFPDVGNKLVKQPSALLPSRDVPSSVKHRKSLGPTTTGRASLKSVDEIEKSTITKKEVHPDKLMDRKYQRLVSKVLKRGDTSRKPSGGNKSTALKQEKSLISDPSRRSLGEQLYAAHCQKSVTVKNVRPGKVANDGDSTKSPQPASKTLSSQAPQLDQESQSRILALIEEAKSSVTSVDLPVNHSSHSSSQRTYVERTITLGKVEGSLEAIRTATKKLDEGYIEDAFAFCERKVLKDLIIWKNKLKLYIAPFIYGARYTSFGRHFTKVEKLKEIVDRLHWYVKEGDMIVDFCCGSNDFSLLMKEKLDQTGKKCSFKNYDIIKPRNTFSFEERDWFSVRRSELPTGSQLIMGLNPPFGVNAEKANKFIDRALEFQPKLIILIVPPETERLDRKRAPYNLVWEDDQKLSGKAFYLPGSVDVNDKTLDDWNSVAPFLSLWTRPDWTVTHKAIAEKHGHIPGKRIEFQSPDERQADPAPEIIANSTTEFSSIPALDVAANPTPKVPAIHTPKIAANPTRKVAANPTRKVAANPSRKVATNPSPKVAANPSPKLAANPTPKPAANPAPQLGAKPTPEIRDEDGDVAMEVDDPPQPAGAKERNERNTKEKGTINPEAIHASVDNERKSLDSSGFAKRSKEKEIAMKRNRISPEEPYRDRNRKRRSSIESYHGRSRHSQSPADLLDVRASDRFSFRNDTYSAAEIEDGRRSQHSFDSPASQHGLGHLGSSAHELIREFGDGRPSHLSFASPASQHGLGHLGSSAHELIREFGDSRPSQHSVSGPASQHGLGHLEPPAHELTSIAPATDYLVGGVSSKYSFGTHDPYFNNSSSRWGSFGSGEADYASRSFAREPDSFNFRSYTTEDPNYNYQPTMPAMQRFGARQDELNHSRFGILGSELPGGSRLGMYDTHQPRFRGGNVPMGFVPGPPSYPHHSSSGWIQE